jgi:thioredoxin 1
MIAPILVDLAAQYDGKVRFAKLNVDDNPRTPPSYEIRGIPTLILFKNGAVVGRKVGALSKGQLAEFLDSHLS